MRSLIAAVLLLLPVVGLTSAEACRPGFATITGTITDDSTRAHLPSAQVFITGTALRAISDSVGHFTFCAPPLKDAQLRVRLIAYQSTTVSLGTIRADTTYQIDVHLKQLPFHPHDFVHVSPVHDSVTPQPN